ncbi:MAG: radical SAM protein [Anaerolineae bacterium]|jgi:MoaA/NifB/PqqE/SkfB family radical SAM enzyme
MALEKRDLYRFPWSMNDNPIAWLEVTDVCNLRCEGCYRQKLTGHKPLPEIKEEILFFKRWRNPDNVSIAGGEPLLHPQIVEIVAFIAENGIKPILLTNGVTLAPELLRELKKAGLVGFTMHIDSHQSRPGWRDRDEAGHNELRQHYADMVAAERGMIMVFNSTVYPSTFREIPDVVRWGQANIDRVNGLVFITYRTLDTGANVALDSEGRAVEASRLGYSTERFDEAFVTSPEVYQIIRDAFPEYDPSGYLGGTIRHDSFKWLAGAVIGSRHGWYGSIGKRTMELAQAGHHLFRGTYLAYLSGMRVSPLIFLMSPWDGTVRKAARNWLRDMWRHPGRLLDGVRVQTIGIIQAPDVQPGGRADMCDSCPDMTVWEGRLINSCRMDEYRLFGDLLSVAENPRAEAESELAGVSDAEAAEPERAAAGGG